MFGRENLSEESEADDIMSEGNGLHCDRWRFKYVPPQFLDISYLFEN